MGFAGQLTSDLEKPLFVEVEASDRLIAAVGELDELEHRVGTTQRLGLTDSVSAEQCPDRSILSHGHRFERSWRLQDDGHTGVAGPDEA